MKKLLLSFFCVFAIFALSAQIHENFSDYTVGGKLAQQAQAMGRTYWTTWNQAPGGVEDGVIAEFQGKKVFNPIGGGDIDQVLLFGNKTDGVWNLSFKIYIPAGKDGFTNVMAVFPTPGNTSDFAIQVYYGATEGGTQTPGQGVLFAGAGTTGVSFSHPMDEWFDVITIIDLDADHAKFFINETQIHQWTYSSGTFGTGCPKVIACMDIFPPNASSNFYVSDIYFGCEFDFDDAAVGSKVAQTYPLWWTPFLDPPGGAEDPAISNEQSASAPNSVKLTWGHDLVFKAGNKTSGVYTFDFDMYIPNNGRAYFNILHLFNGYSSTWAVGFYFNVTASGGGGPVDGTYIQQDGQIIPFTFPYATWFHVSLYLDLDQDIAKAKIDEFSYQWQFSVIENPQYGGSPSNTLAVMDFFPPEVGGLFYLDNFKYCVPGGEPVEEPCDPATNLEVTYSADCSKAVLTWNSPQSNEYNVYRDAVKIAGPISATTFTDEGFNKFEEHNWAVTVICPEGETDPITVLKEPCDVPPVPCDPVTNLEFKSITETEVSLMWTVSENAIKYEVKRNGALIGEPEGQATGFDDVFEFVVGETYTWTVKAICADGESNEEELTHTFVGINDIAKTFSILPNPATDNITIQATHHFNTVEVLSFLGQVVISQSNVGNNTTEINVSLLSNGIYFVRIVSDNNTSVQKFVKK